MKLLHSSLFAMQLCFSSVLVHTGNHDEKSAGDFHFGPVPGDDNNQVSKNEV